MRFGQVRSSTLIALVSTATLAFAATSARAEIIKLDCQVPAGSHYVVDTSAQTVQWMNVTGSGTRTENEAGVSITDSTISWAEDRPPVYHSNTTIDRTTGIEHIVVRGYSDRSLDSEVQHQCTKIQGF